MKMMKMVMKMVMLTSTLTTLALPAATTTVAAPTDMSTPLLHLAPTDGDTVGLLWNAAERRYSVMWDASSGCGWGHASTADFLRYTQHGCTGPDRQHGTMSGSVAFGGDGRPRMTYSMGEQIWLATAPNASMAWFTQDSASTPALNLSAAAAHGIAVLDIRDPYMWSGADGRLNMLTGGGARARGGPGGGRGGTGVGPAACERGSCYPEALLWESDDAPRYTHWTFKGQVWSAPADAARYSQITSCVDWFTLAAGGGGGGAEKQVFMFSDFVLHRVRWLVGTVVADPGADTVHLEVEREGVADWGRLYASQSMTDATGTRRLMMGNIGHPHFMAGHDMLPIPIVVVGPNSSLPHRQVQMVSLPREVSLDARTGGLVFRPARELAAARRRPFSVSAQSVRSDAAGIPMGPAVGSVREVRFTLREWVSAAPGATCGIRLDAGGICTLVVGFTAGSVVVQSSCGAVGTPGKYAALESCPRNADDAQTGSPLAGYCYNITVPTSTTPTSSMASRSTPPSASATASAGLEQRDGRAPTATTNATLTAIVDRSAVEVFVPGFGVVISSGVFVSAGTDAATLELYCDRGGAAVVDATTWLLAVF